MLAENQQTLYHFILTGNCTTCDLGCQNLEGLEAWKAIAKTFFELFYHQTEVI